MQQLASPASGASSSDSLERRALLDSSPAQRDSGEDSSEPRRPKEEGAGTVAERQPLSRRGHFKSRLGCFNCKRRRVKCNEQRPLCSPCRRLGLSCVFPTSTSTASGSSSGSGSGSVKANPSSLNLEDLRFYHQFLTVAFPTLPLSSKETWLQGTAMSHQYEGLAHAVLGLGASHLTQNTDGDYGAQALQHRVVAIKLVNEQLDYPPQKPADADALLATVICLVAQSSLLPDSMVDYLTMTRGCNLVTFTILPDFEKSIFRTFRPKWHMEAIAELASDQPKDPVLIEGFRASAQGLIELCQHSYELRFVDSLLVCIRALDVSAFEAWKEFVTVFMMPTTFTNSEFVAFVEPENHAGHIISIHGFLLDYLLGRMNTIISWARLLASQLPPSYQRYMDWPLHHCDVLARQDGRYLLSP